MQASDYLKWYEDILQRFNAIPRHQWKGYPSPTPVYMYERQAAEAWAVEAGAALEGVFPATSTSRIAWDRLSPKLDPLSAFGGTLENMYGVFSGATQLLKDGRIGSLLDAVRIDTESELLDQAMTLSNAKYVAAAAVIAGGALEAHLRFLVNKNNLVISGDGSISKYDTAIAQARNTGTVTIYGPTDTKLVTGWGGIRNEAAHDPGAVTRSQDDIRRMIDSIREFISRTT